jgi:dTDP-4-dehydrorhamnose reductase
MANRVLVIGKDGQLGKSLAKVIANEEKQSMQHCEFFFVGRNELDLSQPSEISDYFADKQYTFIVNCAAYTAVDKAESEAELADKINHQAVKKLATICKAQGTKLIHISTDYVFDGQNYKPYIETDEVNPRSVYGLTKLKGEQAIQKVTPDGVIIRTSWVYSEFGNNFVKTMLRLSNEREELGVVFDQVGSPTYATDLAKAILEIIVSSVLEVKDIQNSKLDIYHYSNEGVCSWYDFAKAIFELSSIGCQVNPIETKDYPTPAKRPYYSVMNKHKIKQTFNLDIPYWQESLKKCLQELQG